MKDINAQKIFYESNLLKKDSHLLRNTLFAFLLGVFNINAAFFSSESILKARCNNSNTGVLEITENPNGDDYNSGSKLSFSVEEENCPRVWEWVGKNKEKLYSYKKTVPKADFSCIVSSRYGNKVFVRECGHFVKGEYNIYKQVMPRINDYEYGIEVTDPIEFEKGESYFVKGTSYSNGEKLFVGGRISWPDKTKNIKSTNVTKQGVKLERRNYRTVSCTIENVYQQEGYSEVSNCSWSYDYYEFYLNDPRLQEDYSGYRLYRSDGTLKYQGSIEVDKNSGNIVTEGYCYSLNGMKAIKRVNRLDSCK